MVGFVDGLFVRWVGWLMGRLCLVGGFVGSLMPSYTTFFPATIRMEGGQPMDVQWSSRMKSGRFVRVTT